MGTAEILRLADDTGQWVGPRMSLDYYGYFCGGTEINLHCFVSTKTQTVRSAGLWLRQLIVHPNMRFVIYSLSEGDGNLMSGTLVGQSDDWNDWLDVPGIQIIQYYGQYYDGSWQTLSIQSHPFSEKIEMRAGFEDPVDLVEGQLYGVSVYGTSPGDTVSFFGSSTYDTEGYLGEFAGRRPALGMGWSVAGDAIPAELLEEDSDWSNGDNDYHAVPVMKLYTDDYEFTDSFSDYV